MDSGVSSQRILSVTRFYLTHVILLNLLCLVMMLYFRLVVLRKQFFFLFLKIVFYLKILLFPIDGEKCIYFLQFTNENYIYVEFDLIGLYIKDIKTCAHFLGVTILMFL